MKAPEDQDSKDAPIEALEAGLLSLQGQRATSRCLRVVVKRRDELDPHDRGALQTFLKTVNVAGFRPGKAPPQRVLQAVAKNPKFERAMFRRFFRHWMELNTGLDDRVVDVGRKAAPAIDFHAGDWATIADAANAIAARMPQHPREDILLALFMSRFGPAINDPALSEDCAKQSKQSESEDSSDGEQAGRDDDAEATANGHDLDPAAQAVLSSLNACVAELERIEAGSHLWDGELRKSLEAITALGARKLAERRSLDVRAELAAALGPLQEPTLGEELAFLRLHHVCSGWNVDTMADAEIPSTLPTQIRSLVAEIKTHREIRLAAQHATDDEAFELQTAKRKAAKERIRALIDDLTPRFASRASPETVSPRATEETGQAPASSSCASPAKTEPVLERTENDAPHVGLATGDTVAFAAPEDDQLDVSDPSKTAAAAMELAEVDASNASTVAPSSGTAVVDSASSGATPAPTDVNEADRDSVRASREAQSDVSESAEPQVAPLRDSSIELAVTKLLELPVELRSYDRFREHFWTGPKQIVEVAPWKAPAFAERLAAAADAALKTGPARTWEVLTLCRALETRGVSGPVGTPDLRAAASLWISPESKSAGLDPDRCERLRSGRAPVGSSQQRFALLLEAVRPSLERQLLTHEIDALIDQAGFDSGALRVVVHRFLTAAAQGHNPLQLMRHLQRSAAHHAQNLASRLDAARKELQVLVTRLWNAAGGKVQRTHCRHAWTDFVARIQPSLAHLYPPPRGDDAWSIADLAKQIDSFAAMLEEICDRHQAKFDDKRRMLRAAGEIADAARQVVDLRRKQVHADDTKPPAFALPEVEIRQLRETHLERDDEEFARQLLLRASEAVASGSLVHPFAITVGDLCRRPDLLRVIRDVPRESIEALRRADGAIAYADDLTDPIRAAAITLQNPEDGGLPTLESLIERLEHSQRNPLLGLLVQVVDERLQRRIHAERSDALGRLVTAISRISQIVDDLAHLGNRFAAAMRVVRDQAGELIETDGVRLDARLVETWLERVLVFGRDLVQQHVDQLTVEARKRDDSEEILSALSHKQYVRAIRLLQGHSGTEVRGTRQTEWRDEVEPNREALLRAAYGLADPKLKPLLDAWRAGVKGDSVRADRTLRTEFVKIITDGRNMDRDSQPSYVAIPMASIQSELGHAQLMPTFMPQLSRFGRLTVLTPPVSPEQPSFKQGVLSKLGEFNRDLVLLLTPRLPAGRRTEILLELQHRRIAAAVVDDVDLLRLISPGGQRPHQMLGTLEIAFEQQRPGMFSPFELPEGSHVRLEMYVGRRDKARELARTASYSRLFSGRKLGKSALLRFMENSEGGAKLPSGNALRVVYVPAVGIESEATMVEAIIGSLEAAAAIKLQRPKDLEPAEKLGLVLSSYLDDHRAESLLLVLDEADVFFERQLAEYEDRRERCLSFQMRSRFSAMTDEHGLPRVRFVFAGYRVTNRSQGAWSNWGRVLSLDPLEPEDAVRLISGPLAVMGIEVGAHAHEIAYRCGYQPAIILRFGERLVDHLERQPRHGEHYVVSPVDIAQVLEDSRVHDEIRTIARNNFEGNPVGLIVFSAFLRELLELPPGQPLRDAPRRIVERLRTIDDDLSWLERDGDGSATVSACLADFVERSLLRMRRVEGEFSLRFPHHLSVLASLADDARIRDELRRVRTRSDGSADSVERALVGPRVLRDLTEAAQASSKAVGIVGTLWPTGTYDPSGGIPDRLGATPEEIVDARDLVDGQLPLSGVRVVRRTDVATAELVIDETKSLAVRPTLVGGADLLRWGVGRRRSVTDLIYEVHGVARLSIARLTWWFQRVRGLEFARTDALECIQQRTGGIPLLLEIVDNQLVSAAGTTVSDDGVHLALSVLDDAIPTIARSLVSGSPSTALLQREREILQTVESVLEIDSSAGSDLSSALTDLWELFADRCPFPPLSSTDAVALEVLLELGLLPTKTASSWDDPLMRLGPVTADDPIFAIVRAFSAQRATP